MGFLGRLFKKYRNLDLQLSKLTTLKQVSLATLFAILTAIGIGAPFVLALIAAFTFNFMFVFSLVMCFVVAVGILYAYYWFFYFYIKKLCPKAKNIKTNTLLYVEFTAISVVVVVIGALFVFFLLLERV